MARSVKTIMLEEIFQDACRVCRFGSPFSVLLAHELMANRPETINALDKYKTLLDLSNRYAPLPLTACDTTFLHYHFISNTFSSPLLSSELQLLSAPFPMILRGMFRERLALANHS